MTIDQISVFVENRKGAVVEITNKLAEAGISIRALSVADTRDYGILRLIVSDSEKAKAVLNTNNNIVSVTKVIGIRIPDTPGGLSSVLSLVSENDINIEYLYAFITVSGEQACVVLRVEDNDKAADILKNGGIELITQSDIEKF